VPVGAAALILAVFVLARMAGAIHTTTTKR